MLFTEKYLRSILRSRRAELIDEANFISCEGMNQEEADSMYKEVNMIDRVLNGKETIKLADDSVWLYFSNILKIR